MTSRGQLLLDERGRAEIIAALLARRPGFVAGWLPPEQGPGAALIHIHARFLETVLDRLRQAPEKNKLAFLAMMGIECTPARPARAPVVFQLGADAPPVTLAAGAQVAAPPPPETSDQIVFETERVVGLSPAKLVQVVSVWPGRDQYIDHSAAHAAGEAFRAFHRPDLEDIPHAVYLGHERLLALAGKVSLEVDLDLAQPSSAALDIIWEYWDGEVWRRFEGQVPECQELSKQGIDGTKGLTRSGRFHLTADCAEAVKVAVNEVETFWIRGRLDQTLPVDPRRILPEVDTVALTIVVERPLTIAVGKDDEKYDFETSLPAGEVELVIRLKDPSGAPIVGAAVDLVNRFYGAPTDDAGEASATVPLTIGASQTLQVSRLGALVIHKFIFRPPIPSQNKLELDLKLEMDALLPDKAFADATAIDPTKPFYPFGQQPQPGSTFYLSCSEAFGRPGARVELYLFAAATLQDSFDVSSTSNESGTSSSTPIPHRVAWEYWNGRRWAPLVIETQGATSNDDPGDLTGSGTVSFRVPRDMAATKVNDEEALWLRVRLASGTFGFVQEVTWSGNGTDNRFVYPIVRPPALGDLRISYVWKNGPHVPETVITFNDFRYVDRSEAARWPGSVFRPYEPSADPTQSLFLGFDRGFPVDRLTLLFDVVEEPGFSARPELVWEYWAGLNWRQMVVEDGTRALDHPGIVSFIGPADAAPLDRFGEKLYWLRARTKAVGLPFAPEIRRIHTNAAWAVQRQTIANENLGRSTGLPNQVFAFRRFPVLEGEHLEVQELSGARANVEWRLVAAEVAGDSTTVQELEERLGQEGTEVDVVRGDLRLRRDRNKRVSAVFVRWYPRRRVFDAAPSERVYVLDRALGKVRFGDGLHGKIPPLGADLIARSYSAGGGAAGNVAAGAISQLLAGVAGIEAVSNPLPAEGGADVETLEAVAERGPHTLAHRDRAVSARAYETMAREASPALAAAYALPARDPQGIPRPGWVTLVLVPRSKAARPWPSAGLREQVRRYINERMAGEVAALEGLYVTGPFYREIDVDVVAAPLDLALAGAVERGVRTALERFLHPVLGGPERRGWRPGQAVYASDVAAVLEGVEGLDYVRELDFLRDGRPLGEVAPVAEDRLVVAGTLRVRLVGRAPS